MIRNAGLVIFVIILVITVGYFAQRADAQDADSIKGLDRLIANQERILEKLAEIERQLDVIRVRATN